jgi:hypothetical protein
MQVSFALKTDDATLPDLFAQLNPMSSNAGNQIRLQ